MPSHASTYWEGLPPSQTTQYNQTLVTYESETHAEVALSANLYELSKDDPIAPYYEFDIPVVVAANSRRNMGYSVSYGTGNIPSRSETLNLSDNEGAWVDIGYSFLFYGAWYTKVWITSNGFVTFDNRSYNDNGEKWTSPNPMSIPSLDGPDTILAPFWRDLDPSKGGTIEYGIGITGYFTVVWRDIPNKVNSNTQTFTLYFGTFAVTEIHFVYGSITNDVPTSIGIEDQTGKHGESVASMSPGDKVEFTDEPDNYYEITEIKVSMSKLTVGEVNDEEALIFIQGAGDTRPGGINVILDDPTEGKYDTLVYSAASFALGTLALWGPEAFGFLGPVGWVISAGVLVYRLSPVPRGMTVHEADKYTETAYVESVARDENYPSGNGAYDVSISPLIRWQILNPSAYHKLVITAEITIVTPYLTSYKLITSTPLEINLGPTFHLVIPTENAHAYDIATAIKDELAKIKVNVEIEKRSEALIADTVWGSHWDKTWYDDPGGGWDMVWYEFNGAPEDLMSYYLANATPPDGGYNIMGWNNTKADELLLEAFDPEKPDADRRQYHLWKWQETFMHDPPLIVIYYPNDTISARGIAFNLHNPALSNRYVRQAIAHAIPYEKIFTEILLGRGIASGRAPIHPSQNYTDPSGKEVPLFNGEELEPYRYDIDKALRYMELWWYADHTPYANGAVGDSDLSGVVDLDDYLVFKVNAGVTGWPKEVVPGRIVDPDFNNDDIVTVVGDFPLWANAYGVEYP